MADVRLTASRFPSDAQSLNSVAVSLDNAANTALSSLAGTGGMAGDDPTAEVFVGEGADEANYDKRAGNLIDGVRMAADLVRMLDAIVVNTGRAYDNAQYAGTPEGGESAIAEAKPSITQDKGARIDSAFGAGSDEMLRNNLGPFGDIAEAVLDKLREWGIVFPVADRGELVQAKGAWDALSGSLTSASSTLSGDLTGVETMEFPQRGSMTEARGDIVAYIDVLADEADALGQLCQGLVDGIDDTWQALGGFFAQMAAEILLELGLSAVIGFFTAGLGVAAGLAKVAATITKWAIKIAEKCKWLASLMRTVASGLVRNAHRIDGLVKEVTKDAGGAAGASFTVNVSVQAIENGGVQDIDWSEAAAAAGGAAAGAGAGRLLTGGMTEAARRGLPGNPNINGTRAGRMGTGAVSGGFDGFVSATVEGALGNDVNTEAAIGLGAILGGAFGTIGGGKGPSTPPPGGPGGPGGPGLPNTGGMPGSLGGSAGSAGSGGSGGVNVGDNGAPTPGGGGGGNANAGGGNPVDVSDNSPTPGGDAGGTFGDGGGGGGVELPGAEAPSGEAPSGEAPSVEAPSGESPSGDTPGAEAPSAEAPAGEAPSAEAPSGESPSAEAPAGEAPSAEAPTAETPSAEAPSAEAPAGEAPSGEAPGAEAPVAAAPSGGSSAAGPKVDVDIDLGSVEAGIGNVRTSVEADTTVDAEAPEGESPSVEAPGVEAPAASAPAAPAAAPADGTAPDASTTDPTDADATDAGNPLDVVAPEAAAGAAAAASVAVAPKLVPPRGGATPPTTNAPAADAPTTDPAGRYAGTPLDPNGPESGPGWQREADAPNTDPGYGQPRQDRGKLDPESGWSAQNPKPDFDDITPALRDLPDIRDGYDPNDYGTDPVTGERLDQDGFEERYVDADGNLRYPPNAGAVPGSIVTFDSTAAFREHFPDVRLDRIGGDGRYFSLEGTPFRDRALPPGNLRDPYSVLDLNDLPPGIRIEVSVIDQGFGQPGGGVQIRFIDAANPRSNGDPNALPQSELIRRGILSNADSASGRSSVPSSPGSTPSAPSTSPDAASPSNGAPKPANPPAFTPSSSAGSPSAPPASAPPSAPSAPGTDAGPRGVNPPAPQLGQPAGAGPVGAGPAPAPDAIPASGTDAPTTAEPPAVGDDPSQTDPNSDQAPESNEHDASQTEPGDDTNADHADGELSETDDPSAKDDSARPGVPNPAAGLINAITEVPTAPGAPGSVPDLATGGTGADAPGAPGSGSGSGTTTLPHHTPVSEDLGLQPATPHDTPPASTHGETSAHDGTPGEAGTHGRGTPPSYGPDDVARAWDNAYRNADGVPADPRTDAPLRETTAAGSRGWVMHWDDTTGTWQARNPGDGWGDTPRPGGMEFDPTRGENYTSGDPHHPGDYPPHTPDLDYTPDSESGWAAQRRGESGMVYQEQISGIERLADGRIAEYIQLDLDTGKPVSFDGHTHRGHPPVEVFLEAKDGYAQLHYRPDSDWSKDVARSLLRQARRQTRALPDGAILEWHVSDSHGAQAIDALFRRKRIEDISVIYTPKG